MCTQSVLLDFFCVILVTIREGPPSSGSAVGTPGSSSEPIAQAGGAPWGLLSIGGGAGTSRTVKTLPTPSRLLKGCITLSDGGRIGSDLILPVACLEPIQAALFKPAIGLVGRNPAIEEIQSVEIPFADGHRSHFRGKRLLERQAQGVLVGLNPCLPRRRERDCSMSVPCNDGLDDLGIGIEQQQHGIGESAPDKNHG